jgi:hypothetical protein
MHKFITKATTEGKMTEQTMALDTDTQSIDPNMITQMAEFVNQLGGYVKDMQGCLRSIEKEEVKEQGHKDGPHLVFATRERYGEN